MHSISCNLTSFVVPGKPKDLKTIQVDESTIELSWSPPVDPNGNLIEYRIVYLGYKEVEDNVSAINQKNSISLMQ